MRAPDFWYRGGLLARLAAGVLVPLGWGYGASVARKARCARPHRSGAKVICIGNLTAGGSGKTPVAIAIARLLAARGLRVALLTRGYGGRLNGPCLVDPQSHSAADVGDEALLLAQAAPTVLARDRAAGARLACREGFEVIVMDDGHQNFALGKDLSLVVIDAESGFGNEHVIPAGPLREPVRQGLARADAVILVGGGSPDLHGYSGPVLRAHIRTLSEAVPRTRRVLAFAGIGRPEKFFDALREAGADVVEGRGFGDHHVYTRTELAHLKAAARTAHATPITTEKDFVRLRPTQRDGVAVLAVHAVFDEPDQLARLLDRIDAEPKEVAP